MSRQSAHFCGSYFVSFYCHFYAKYLSWSPCSILPFACECRCNRLLVITACDHYCMLFEQAHQLVHCLFCWFGRLLGVYSCAEILAYLLSIPFRHPIKCASYRFNGARLA